MGYRVEYQPMKKLRRLEQRRSRAAALTGCCFLLFLIVVCCVWPQGREVLRGLVFQGNAVVTVAALEEMTMQLQSGMPFVSALEGFCHAVIAGSRITQG